MSEYKLGDAIKEFLNHSKLKSGIRALQIEEIWEQVMGKTISKYTDKLEIIHQTLFIHTSVGPLKQELMYQKDKIIERINEAMGEKMIYKVIIK